MTRQFEPSRETAAQWLQGTAQELQEALEYLDSMGTPYDVFPISGDATTKARRFAA